MKRLHTLCVALLALVLCNTPLFAEDFAVDGIYYNITSETDKTVAVTYRGSDYSSYSNEYSGAITIPESVTYNGSTYSVTSIGEDAFEFCYGLTSVVIPNSVTSIGDEAFAYCDGLTSVEIPNSVTSIGSWAFSFCSSLTSVVIPNNVTSIGEAAFSECSSLTSVVIPNSVTSIGVHAFSYCSSLMSVEIPNSVTSIGDEAFSGCSRLTTATVGCSWKTNPLYDFSSGVTVNATLHSYENGVCTVCGENSLKFEVDGIYYNITSPTNKTVEVTYSGSSHDSYSDEYSGAVTIPESVTYSSSTYSVTSIGDYAFYDCDGLTSVEIPNSVTSIGKYAFYECSSLTSVEIPNSVTSIGSSAFEHCNGLTSVVIPKSVTSIGEGTFFNCSSLTSVEIPNSVTSIGKAAFEYCSSLTSVVIPNSVTSIGDYAFYFCSSLTSVVIPNSVTSIGSYAFDDCSRLTSVVIPNSVTSIGNSAFYYCSSLTSIAVAEDNQTYDSRNNCNAIIETQTNTLIAGCSETTIPNSVTSIGHGAFRSCSRLTSVEIPNSVTSIRGYAFSYCSSLTSVAIPNSVTSIGYSAFYGCSSLTTATVGCSWITEPLYEFDKNVTVNATLHSYENGQCTVCGKLEYIELVEGTPFENDETCEVAKVTYNRTLPNLKWNALYLPVEIPVSELSENYDLAYFNDMHAYDRNSDGVVDEMDMEIFLIKEGTLHANHPYFIRAKSEAAKQLQLVLNNVVLHPAEETSLTCSSVYTDFTLTGVYTRHMAEDLPGCYAINTSGAWSPIAAGSYLNPFRCYLKMTARDGSPVKVDEALKSIRIRVHGEDGTTDIDDMTINGQQPAVIYDLQGRRVSNPGKGMYIVNGKKVMLQ